MRSRSTRSDGETEPLDAPQSFVGRVLDGRYKLQEMINLGGMGIIFRAEQVSTGRAVAVKLLKPSKSGDTDVVRRFEREADVLGGLSHPNIVSMIASGKDAGGLAYVVMEYVKGATLRNVLKNGALSLIEIVDIFAKTTSALAEAHDADVIHRDLKFDNVMVGRQADGRLRVTVLDFGVAKPMTEQRRLELTREGQVPGTPAIVAPELVDERPPTPRSDLYSLGVLIYAALAGREPFDGENDLELMRAHKFDDLPDLRSQVPDYVPASLVDLTERLLEKEPEARPPGAPQVRDELEAIRRELWTLPLEGHPYGPDDEGPAEFRKYRDRVEQESSDEGDRDEDVPDWVQSFFDK
jgi:serine/threonine-protein kinase